MTLRTSPTHRISPAQKGSTPAASDRGASLLELAIFLPVLALLVTGLIDYGSALREIHTISTAVREGARIAASHSRSHGPVACASSTAGAGTIACDAQDLTILPGDAVASAARKATCSFLQSSRLSAADWKVEPRVQRLPRGADEAQQFQVVTVDIERNAGAPACIVCWDRMFEALKARSESSFVLEAACTE